MTIKLGSIENWQRVDKGKRLVLPGKPVELRKIRIDVATFIKTTFLLVLDGGKQFFPLGPVDGHGVLEFWHQGNVEIDADANFYYRSADGQSIHAVVEDAEPFVQIANPRVRNFQQELIEYQVWANANKRIAKLEAEWEAKMAAMGVNPETGEIGDGVGSGTGSGAAAPTTPPASDQKDAKPPEGGDGANPEGNAASG